MQLSVWEINLFGRLASLSEAARAQLLVSEAARRGAELRSVAAVLPAGLALRPTKNCWPQSTEIKQCLRSRRLSNGGVESSAMRGFPAGGRR